MNEKITVHGNPEKSVFGLVGSDVLTDEEKFYIKVENDTKNTGWVEIPPTPSVTPTITVTPTKTPIVTKQFPVTPTPTPTRTPSMTPSLSYVDRTCFSDWLFTYVNLSGVSGKITGLTSGAIRSGSFHLIGKNNTILNGVCAFNPTIGTSLGNSTAFTVGEIVQFSSWAPNVPVAGANLNETYIIEGSAFYDITTDPSVLTLRCNPAATPTPTPTSTTAKSYYNYTIVADPWGQAYRVDGSPSERYNGVVNVGTSTMQLQAVPDSGYVFSGWDVPEGVILSDPQSTNPIASGFFVHTDVVITARFSATPTYDTCPVTGEASQRGCISFSYTNEFGAEQNYGQCGYTPNSTAFNLVNANAITHIYEGNAYLSCGSSGGGSLQNYSIDATPDYLGRIGVHYINPFGQYIIQGNAAPGSYSGVQYGFACGSQIVLVEYGDATLTSTTC